jgi:ribosomal protein L7/L12
MAADTLVIEGWTIGFNKVAFTKLLQEELDLPLSSAKEMTDQILNGEKISVNVSGKDMDRISDAVVGLGAKVTRSSASVEDSCR